MKINKSGLEPTATQLAREFGLNPSTVYAMKKNNSKLLYFYQQSFMFRLLDIKPFRVNVQELAEFAGTTKSNIYLLKKKDTRLYHVYLEAYSLKIAKNTLNQNL